MARARKATSSTAVASDVKENDPVADNGEKDAEDAMVPQKKGSVKAKKAAGGAKAAGKKGAKPARIVEEEEENDDENVESREKKEQVEASAEEDKEPSRASSPEPNTAEETKEEMAPPKRGRKPTAKKEESDEPAATAADEKEAVPEEPVAKGGRKAPAATGKKGKKEEEAKEEQEEQEEQQKVQESSEEEPKEEEVPKKAAPKGRAGKKATAKQEEEEEAEEIKVDEEEVVVAPKKGRKAAAASTDDEPQMKKTKTEKGRGKKAAEKEEEEEKEEEMKEEEEEKKEEVKPKGRGRPSKKAVEKEEEKTEEQEEVEKPAGRPKRGAATKAAAAAKKAAEDDGEDEEDVKPKRGRKAAAKKMVEKSDDEDEEQQAAPAAKSKGRKQPAKGRGKGKKAGAAAAVDDDEEDDGPTGSKKPKIEEEEEEENGKSGGKSMTKSIRRTVQVKGKAAVDPLCTRKASNSHVYESGDLIYDVMLNQTNIGNNNNKYYVIQLLEEDDKNHYSVWMRWGRVGYDGMNKLVECGTNLQKAISEFAKKFEDKTRNRWPTSFADFETHAGKYTMIEMDYGNGDGGEDVKMEQEQEEEEKKAVVESKLDARVQQLVHLMCSIRTMTQAVKELEFDADKSPLGKLTQQQIKEGFTCLGKIEKFIEKADFGAAFKQAVNEYYTKVPHACGFRPPAMIKTKQLLKQEIELLDLLSGIEYAIKTMKQEVKEDDVHPVDRHYASLKCDLQPMEKSDEEYKLVSEYLSTTHGATHSIRMGLKNVFRVGREGEEANEAVMDKIGNRKLLWHGSRLSNYFGILSQGLRIAPPEAPCTGYMFGKGVYFADMASKSGNYCYVSEDGQTGFLLLAEVALGEENQLKQAKYDANKLPAGKSSTWGVGRTMPDPTQNKQLNDKVVVPCGKPITTDAGRDASLLYNEFIVYDTQQIRMRYLLEIEFNFY